MNYKPCVLREIEQFQEINTPEQFEHMSLFIKNVFKQEEAVLKEHDVPDLDVHQAAHDELVRSIESFKDQFLKKKDRAPDGAVTKLVGFLRLWIEDHQDSIDNFSESYIRIHQWITP